MPRIRPIAEVAAQLGSHESMRYRPGALVAWSTRKMPYWLREKLRAEALLRGQTIEDTHTQALTIGLRCLERRRERALKQTEQDETIEQIRQSVEHDVLAANQIMRRRQDS